VKAREEEPAVCAELESKLQTLASPVRGKPTHRQRLHDALRRGASLLERRRPRLRWVLLVVAAMLILASLAVATRHGDPAPGRSSPPDQTLGDASATTEV